jgi:aquaporin NIP
LTPSASGFDWRRYASEALGTFALVAVGPGAVMVAASTHAFGHVGVALAFGLVIAFVVAATGHLGGAHINPAVTIAFWSVRRFPARDVLPYIIAQCAGAAAAAFALRWLLGPVAALGATIPALSLGRAFAVECGYSAFLGFVIMGVATDERSAPGVAPFALGATVGAGALVTGPLTGGSFNPARSFGPALVAGEWTAHWLYWAAPIAGMILAMKLYEVLRAATVHQSAKARVTGVEGLIGARRAALVGESAEPPRGAERT